MRVLEFFAAQAHESWENSFGEGAEHGNYGRLGAPTSFRFCSNLAKPSPITLCKYQRPHPWPPLACFLFLQSSCYHPSYSFIYSQFIFCLPPPPPLESKLQVDSGFGFFVHGWSWHQEQCLAYSS